MKKLNSLLCAAAVLAFTVGTAGPVAAEVTAASTPAPVVGHAAIGAFGLDLAAMDTSVKPGDDFERYASGTWIKNTPIPANEPYAGVDLDITNQVRDDIKQLIMQAPAGSRYGTLYASFMDENAVERAGLKPLMADLAPVRAITGKDQFTRFMGATYDRFGISLFGQFVDADTADPNTEVLWLTQGGLGLPDKSYYSGPEFAKQREAYQAYIERTLAAIGTPDPAAAAAQVMNFETEVAKLSWSAADSRQIDKINNPYSTAELKAYAPGLDWDAYFAGAKISPQKRIIVNQNSAIKSLAELYNSTPLATLKLWEEFHIASQASPYLDKKMVDSRFDFIKTLTGTSENLPRWKRAISLVSGALGEEIGKVYVAKRFPPAAKAQMVKLVANLKLAMADRIRANDWMSPATKQAALEKLSKMRVMVGYPDKWRDYSSLHFSANDLYGNVKQATKLNADYDMSHLDKPVDFGRWDMTPQTVNAYNGFPKNVIVFPAAYLQPPKFDPNADPAVNYGAIGATIGHEISHGFDDQGRKVDASGKLRDWWTAADNERFQAEAKKFGAQYAALEILPGLHINPELTMGENIADFAGLNIAYDAYHRSLGGKPAPVIDGLTGDQRFFLAYAQAFRSKWRPDLIREIVSSDPHSPDRARVLVPPANMDAWYQAFDVQPGQKMYRAPADRVHIW